MVRAFIKKNGTYLVSLIFRIYYVVFSISYPLLALKDELPIHALNVYAAVSVATMVLSFFSFRVYRISVTRVRSLAILVSLLNIAFFCTKLQANAAYCYFFAIAMGVAASSIEISSLSLATKNNDDKVILRSSLVLMNILKVMGIAFGFLIGCLVSSGETARQIGYYSIAIIATLCILLSIKMTPISSTPERFNGLSLFAPPQTRKMSIFLFSIALFALDLAVFGFWFTALPTSLKEDGWELEIIGALLAVEAISHAASQKTWHRLAGRFGDLKIYFSSLALHISMLTFMMAADFKSIGPIFLAFVLLGISNSGTFVTSSAYYYTRDFNLGKFQLIAVHQVASSFGKLLGPLIALQFMKM